MDKGKSLQKKRSHQSQHKLEDTNEEMLKFKTVKLQKHHSTEKFIESNQVSICQNQKQYSNLEKKLAQKQKMTIGTRNFSKTFYSKLAKKIIQKPLSFFKFGLKQEEKSTCKSVFSQLFKIKPQKLKGTIGVADLWDNKTTMKYLKQNEMFFNKDILLKQFQTIDKQQKQRRRELQLQKQRQFVRKYREMVKQNEHLNKNNQNYQQMRGMNSKQACSFIRYQIDKLADLRSQFRVKTRSRKIIDRLEKDYDEYDRIADKFKNRMIVLL